MFLRSTPVLCIVFLLLFTAPVPRSAPHPFPLPLVDAATSDLHLPPSSGLLRVPNAASIPASGKRSSDRTPAMRTRTIRAALRELLPEISLIAVLPVAVSGPGAFLAACHRFGREVCFGPADGSRNLFSGLSPPVRS